MPINTLPKSFKLLSKYEKAEIFTAINVAARGIQMNTERTQNAGVCQSHAETVIKLAKKLQRCQVAEATVTAAPVKFVGKLTRAVRFKFGVSMAKDKEYNFTREGVQCFVLMEDGVGRGEVDSRLIEIVKSLD